MIRRLRVSQRGTGDFPGAERITTFAFEEGKNGLCVYVCVCVCVYVIRSAAAAHHCSRREEWFTINTLLPSSQSHIHIVLGCLAFILWRFIPGADRSAIPAGVILGPALRGVSGLTLDYPWIVYSVCVYVCAFLPSA